MNTDVLFVTAGPPQHALLAGAEALFHAYEARFSRFIEDSELSRLNQHSGTSVSVSLELLEILQLAVTMHRRTGGVFEPAVLPQLEAAGYDRSFERVERDGAAAPTTTERAHSIAQVVIDERASTVRAPAGMRIDLGGIGKGYTVDAAIDLLRPSGSVLVDAGGDMRGIGGGPDGDGWPIGVSDPFDPARQIDLIWLRDAGLATSTTAVRRWRRGGRWLNHIIDPRTGAPTTSDAVSVSVLAQSAVEADVLAKCALVLGPDEGRELLRARGAEGLFALSGGGVLRTPGWLGTAAADERSIRQ